MLIEVNPFLKVCSSFQVLAPQCFPERESKDRIIITKLHVSDCEFYDELQIVCDKVVAVLAKLKEDFIYFRACMSVFKERC